MSRQHGKRVLRKACRVLLPALLLINGCGGRGPAPDFKPERSSPESGRTITVSIAGQRFELELAVTPEARFRGLSHRAHIPENGGMLFVFPRPAPAVFVMRDCLVPIDIIFLDMLGRVLNTHRMSVEPYGRSERELTRYPSRGPALMAIELAGGTLDRLELAEGDRIELPVSALAAMAR